MTPWYYYTTNDIEITDHLAIYCVKIIHPKCQTCIYATMFYNVKSNFMYIK